MANYVRRRKSLDAVPYQRRGDPNHSEHTSDYDFYHNNGPYSNSKCRQYKRRHSYEYAQHEGRRSHHEESQRRRPHGHEETRNHSPQNDSSRRQRKRHRQRKRQRHEHSISSPRQRAPYAETGRHRGGVVSVDDDLSEISDGPRNRRQRERSNESSSGSSHEDAMNHFTGDAGAMIGDQYQVIREVGVGTFGRVLDCLDLRRRDYVAVKIVRAVKRYYESALIEAKIIQDINRRGGRGLTHCVRLFDSFTFRGHYCLVFESLGPSLYDFLKRHDYRPFPMIVVQDMTVQLLQALEFLHSVRLIHTDLKLENILLVNDRETIYNSQRVPESTRIKLIDFGSACYAGDKRSSIINTRQYRAPEVILGAGWSMPSDMWSAGCILVEIYKGELLFATHDSCEHLALMDQVIDPFPRRLIRHAMNASKESILFRVFDGTGRMKDLESILSPNSASYVRSAETLAEIVRNPVDLWFLKLLRRMLVIDPEVRSTAHECLQYLSQVKRNYVRCA